ncbi:unnamed protein product [Rhodiola kirilowii]
MRERYSFRFTNFEIAEMRRVLEGHCHARPTQAEMEGLALSFSKARQQQGMTCARVESIQSWYKRNRRGYTRASRGKPRVKSTKSATSTLAAQPADFANQKHTADEEASEKSNSEEESSEEEMSDSTDSGEGRTDSMDVSMKPTVHVQGAVPEVDSVLARLARYRKVKSEAESKSKSKSIIGRRTDSSTLSVVGQAKVTLEKLKGLSLVDFRKYEEDLKSAIQTLLEEGGLLSENEKAELPLLPVKLHKIAQENERVRKELADCGAFMDKLQECKENTVKLMEKARILEEKYNAFPRHISTPPTGGDDCKYILHHAMAKSEIMKSDKEDVIVELVKLGECLLSASTHYKILKAEEEAVVEKRNKLMDCLQRNTKEWVKLTNSEKLSFI